MVRDMRQPSRQPNLLPGTYRPVAPRQEFAPPPEDPRGRGAHLWAAGLVTHPQLKTLLTGGAPWYKSLREEIRLQWGLIEGTEVSYW